MVIVLVLATLFACLCVCSLPVSWWLKSIVCITLGLLGWKQVLRHALLHASNSIVALAVNVKSELSCQYLSGDWLTAELLPTTTVTPRLTVLNLKLSEQHSKLSVVIMTDSIAEEEFRKLRVWLKWAHHADSIDG